MPLSLDMLIAPVADTRFAKLRDAQTAALKIYVADAQGWSDMATMMRAYWKGWSRHDAAGRGRLRSMAAKQLPPPGWLLRAIKASAGPFLTETELFSEWPK